MYSTPNINLSAIFNQLECVGDCVPLNMCTIESLSEACCKGFFCISTAKMLSIANLGLLSWAMKSLLHCYHDRSVFYFKAAEYLRFFCSTKHSTASTMQLALTCAWASMIWTSNNASVCMLRSTIKTGVPLFSCTMGSLITYLYAIDTKIS